MNWLINWNKKDWEEFIKTMKYTNKNHMETPNKTEVIENEIITLLNKAEIDLNRSEFESLAESIIDYIDEIARRKK
jgi:hypothetical protein